MQINYSLHGILKSMADSPTGTIELPEEASVSALIGAIEKTEPNVSFQGAAVSIAVNESLVSSDCNLNDGDSVSFLPPLAGG